MRRLITLTLSAMAWLGIAPPSTAVAQAAKDLVGTWTIVSDINTRADGSKVEPFGPNPKGLAIFDSGGRFTLIISRPDLPKFASNNRMQGTPEENKTIVQGSFAIFGTYSMTDKVLIQSVEGGTWPSWTGTDQKRTIVSFTGDELTWTTTASFGGTAEVRWKRLK
jgi:hypothetical protein